jgi:RimJ/RimL family protein N-acetyltransferase
MTIRPLDRSDRAALAFVFSRLSAQSRYQRFLFPRRDPSRAELEQLIKIDHWHAETVIAFDDVPRRPLGTARYVRLNEFDVADIAVEVADEWQRRGVGRALMRELRARALPAGIRHFHATMLSENRGARALAEELGRTEVTGVDHGALELVIHL